MSGTSTVETRRYKQGVEIRSQLDRIGTWKLTSGVEGHLALVNGRKLEAFTVSGSAFRDSSLLPPSSYLQALSGVVRDDRYGGVSISEARQPSNGIIEPLDIRSFVAPRTNVSLSRFHVVSGELCMGSRGCDDAGGGTFTVETVRLRPVLAPSGSSCLPFADGVAGDVRLTGGSSLCLRPETAKSRSSFTAVPFRDNAPQSGFSHSGSTIPSDMQAALNLMVPSRNAEFLVEGDERGSGGWNFTDSLAFAEGTF